jgi:DNA topoisomerase III
MEADQVESTASTSDTKPDGRGRGGRGGRGGNLRDRGRGRGGQSRPNDISKASSRDQSKEKNSSEINDEHRFGLSKVKDGGKNAGNKNRPFEKPRLDTRNKNNQRPTSTDPRRKGGNRNGDRNDGRNRKLEVGSDGVIFQTNGETNTRIEGGPKEELKQQIADKEKHNSIGGTARASAASLAPKIPPSQPQQSSDIYYAKGVTITVLHVAEKPSIAQAIANGLAEDSKQIDAHGRTLPTYEFQRPAFPKAPHASQCNHRVSSVAGHVFNTDFPPNFQSWDSVDPAELFDAPVVKIPSKGSVVKHLQEIARGVDFIVLWMDCDREGENINFEVLDCCMHLMKSGGSSSNYDRVYRAFFSAINPSDIKKAYQALGKPDKNQALAVEARQELDLKVGVAFSRFQTRYFQGRYGDLDSAVLSYGPCQTPTLGFCVQRHVEIETFKPEPYWVLELGIMKRGRVLKALWDSGRSFQQSKVELLKQRVVETNAVAEVQNVVLKEAKQARPIALNTVAMLKACSKALGIGPHSALKIAESLYLSGYLSYPRTESSAYPKSFDIAGTLSQQTGDSRWGAYVRNLLKEGHSKSRGGLDMGDHPPITPTRSGVGLSGDMARVYDLVVRHFIASVSQDAVWNSTRIEFVIVALGDKGNFTLRGKQLASPGFLEILLHKEYGEEKEAGDDDEEERTIPVFTKGEVIPLTNSTSCSNLTKSAVASGEVVRATLDIKGRMTTPPTYLTESKLIGLMEKYGIGTDASIATHIENVLKRNYVTLESGRRLLPSKLGLVLAQGYHLIDSSLVLPRVRSDIEDQCNKIAKGLASREDVVRRALDLFKGKFDVFVKSINKMDVLFSSSFLKLADVGKPFTRCGLTRRYLQYIPGPPERLYNKWTETVYPLPAGGIIKQWTGKVCPVKDCNFELCLYSIGQPQRTFPLCPRCFNSEEWGMSDEGENKDAEERDDEAKERQIKRMAGKSLTLACPLPASHPLIDEITVSPDPDSDGVLLLDPHLGPKWRLISTRTPTIIHLPQSIEKITVLDRRDEVFNVHMMKIEFKPGQSPLPSGDTKHICSFANDAVLQGLVRVFHGSDRLKAGARGGRGRGRGGRGGRGERGRR